MNAFHVSLVAVNIIRIVAVNTASAIKTLRPIIIDLRVGFLVFEEEFWVIL
ncbi:hypothetical protein ES703_124745 [subsurface metagenome]